MDGGTAAVLDYLREHLDFESAFYNDAYLDRRLTARMRRTDADDPGQYLQVLRASDREQRALLEALSINVTSFFRNPSVWEALRPVLRELTAGGSEVRLWSTPCSDGREPYSLAMLALDDPEVDADRISVLGSDIDADALETARTGRYSSSQTTDIAEELAPLDGYREYVARDGDCFRVRDRVRDLVTFERHDLIRDSPKSGFDLTMCRNLLIYIDNEYKREVLDTVVSSIRDDGYLVIGTTETLPRDARSTTVPADKTSRIYRVTG